MLCLKKSVSLFIYFFIQASSAVQTRSEELRRCQVCCQSVLSSQLQQLCQVLQTYQVCMKICCCSMIYLCLYLLFYQSGWDLPLGNWAFKQSNTIYTYSNQLTDNLVKRKVMHLKYITDILLQNILKQILVFPMIWRNKMWTN